MAALAEELGVRGLEIKRVTLNPATFLGAPLPRPDAEGAAAAGGPPKEVARTLARLEVLGGFEDAHVAFSLLSNCASSAQRLSYMARVLAPWDPGAARALGAADGATARALERLEAADWSEARAQRSAAQRSENRTPDPRPEGRSPNWNVERRSR